MSKNLYIVTGVSSGIGKNVCMLLLKNQEYVLGISKSKLKITNKRYKFLNHNFKKKLKITNISKLIKKYQNLTIICAAGSRIPEREKNKNISNSININFTNQMSLFTDLKKIKKINKIVFFSSFNIFRKKNVTDIGYQISKTKLYNVTLKDKSNILQCYVLGNVLTKMNKSHPSILKSLPIIGSYLEKKITIHPSFIAKNVLINLNENNKKIFFIPRLNPYIIKIIIIILEKINKLFNKSTK